MSKVLRKSDKCLNCGTDTQLNDYCAFCGQLNTDRRVSVRTLIEDFLGDYFTFDSKFFRSFIPLIFNPGYLTNEYNDGKRMKYILPLRLYIFVSILFFFILTILNSIEEDKDPRELAREIRIKYYEELIENEPNDSTRSSYRKSIEYVKSLPLDSFVVKRKITFGSEKKDSIKNSNLGVSSSTPARFTVKSSSNDTSSWAFKFEKLLKSQIERMNEKSDPESYFLKQLVENIPKMMFVLLPIFALLLKLFYIRRNKFYIEHFIFSLHIHSLIFIYLMIANLFSNVYVVVPMILLSVFSLYKSLKMVYNQSRLKTLVKMAFITISYFFISAVAFGFLALYTIAYNVE